MKFSRILPLLLVFLTACASRGPGVTEVGVIAQHDRNIQLAATAAAQAVDGLITKKLIHPQDADPILLALRGVGQGGKSLADALDAYRLAKTPEARNRAVEIVTKLQSSLYEAILALPTHTTQLEVWAKIQPVFQAIATAAIALTLRL